MPSFPGYSAGTVIDQSNVDKFRDILTFGQYQVIKKGWYKIQTRPTFSEMLRGLRQRA